MKNKLHTMAIILGLLLFPAVAWGTATQPTTGDGTNENPYEITIAEHLEWVFANGGFAKLMNDLDYINGYIVKNAKIVSFDLNGHYIKKHNYHGNYNDYETSGYIIKIENGAELTIRDDSDTKTGAIKEGRCKDTNGGGIINEGTFYLVGGTITDNGNYSLNGGGIYNSGSGTMIMSGGTISGNYSYHSGGGIYNLGTLTITGGSITSNSHSYYYGGGIYNGGTLIISGNPTITGNSGGNLYIPENLLISIGTDGITGNDASIGITMQTPGTFTTGSTSDANYQKFVSDDPDYEVVMVGASDKNAILKSCWSLLNDQIAQAISGSTIELSKDYKAVDTDTYLNVPGSQNVTLNLNGHTLDRRLSIATPNGCVINIESGGELTISGEGVIKGGKSSNTGGAIHNSGTLTITGGTIRDNSSTYAGGGIYNNGTLTINGGSVYNNTTSKLGAGIYNATSKTLTLSGGTIDNNTNNGENGGGIYNAGTLTISSGSITNNKVIGATMSGGGIYNNGSLTINGGTIQNNTATNYGGGIYHDGATFNLQGSPTISSNKVGNNNRNIYLTAAHHTINITGDLDNSDVISVTMETPSVFTTGLNSHSGTYEKFSSEISNSVKLTETGNEAELITYWNYLSRQLESGSETTITLESGKTYQAGNADTHLHVPNTRTVTLNLNNNTINRYLSSAISNGCVIYNQGTLTVTGTGTITGGNNNDAGEIKGGGICNKGTLHIEGGTISNNKTSMNGGGIYHDGVAFSLKGAPVIKNNTVNSVANNVYLTTGKTITIDGTLSYSTDNAIGISSADAHRVFTSGLNGKGNASHFTSNRDGSGIGLNSAGEAIFGPNYTIAYSKTNSNVYINNSTEKTTAVEGEYLSAKITSSNNCVPISFERSTGGVFHAYPEANVDYTFDMPADNITITAISRPGGYCGATDIKDMKYYLEDNTLKFITKDASSYQMKNYETYTDVPWKNYTFSAVNIPTNVTTISDYAFYGSGLTSAAIHSGVTSIGNYTFGKCTSLTAINIDGSNANYSSTDGVLYDKSVNKLICYPAGKANGSYELPSGITSISGGAFDYESKLQSITVAGGNANYMSENGVLYSKDGGSNPISLIHYPSAKEDLSYTIPTTVTSITEYAFLKQQFLMRVFLLHTSVPTGGTEMFKDITYANTFRIMVNGSLLDTYKSASNWNSYNSNIFKIDLSNATVTLSPNPNDNKDFYDYVNDDAPIHPDVTTVVSGAGDGLTLTKDVDYTVSWNASKDHSVGTGEVNITGIGNYAGTSTIKKYDITRKVVFSNVTGRFVTYYATEDLILPEPILDGDVYDSYTNYHHAYKAFTIHAGNINWSNKSTNLSDDIGYIPANMPLLLYNLSPKAFKGPLHLKKYSGSATSVATDPNFRGVTTATSYGELITGNSAIYVLKNDKFTRATAGTIPANRCYIAIPNTSSARMHAPLFLSIGSGDSTTEIEDETISIDSENGDIYNLNGQKIEKPGKGLYIKNGKKVIIK